MISVFIDLFMRVENKFYYDLQDHSYYISFQFVYLYLET